MLKKRMGTHPNTQNALVVLSILYWPPLCLKGSAIQGVLQTKLLTSEFKFNRFLSLLFTCAGFIDSALWLEWRLCVNELKYIQEYLCEVK